MSQYLKAAIEAARIGGKIQLEHYGKIHDIQYKSQGSINLVTEVDKKCEKQIQAYLKKRFPRFSFWGEESGKTSKKTEYTWIVDPLDGTTNYAHGYPFFCCSVALVKDEHPVAGAIFDAMSGELFTAERGEGAFLNSRRLKVSGIPKLEFSLLATGFAYGVRETHYNLDNFKRFVLTAQGVRRDGSAALNLAYLAAGRFDGFWERGIQAWDMAAAVLMIQEAGGVVTDITGEKWDLHGQNALASNGRIHHEMMDLLTTGIDEKRWRARKEKTTRKKEEPVIQQSITSDLPLFAIPPKIKKKRRK